MAKKSMSYLKLNVAIPEDFESNCHFSTKTNVTKQWCYCI